MQPEPRVLYLDDEPEYAVPFVDALTRRRFHVELFSTTDEVEERLKRPDGRDFDVLILDMLMPGSHGRDVLGEEKNPVESGLRLHHTIRAKLGIVDVPIIFMSVVRDPKVRDKIRQEETRYRNRVSFVNKPVLPTDLIERIKKVTVKR